MRAGCTRLGSIIEGAPDSRAFTWARRDELIAMPAPRQWKSSAPQIGGDHPTGLHCRGADRFAENVDASMRRHFLAITQAEPGAETRSDRVLNDRRQKAAPLAGISRHWVVSGG